MSSYMLDYFVDEDGEVLSYEFKHINRMNIILLYYSFTSITTVGFGDYYPRSDSERCIIIIFLFVGVNLFSMISGEFLAMLSSYN